MHQPNDSKRPLEPALRSLDVRPILAGGNDPLDGILRTLEPLLPGSALHLVAPFRPKPLLRLLAEKGHAADAVELADDIWSVAVAIGGGFPIDDLRALPPPEPMEAVLSSLVDGGPYLARLPRYPRLLEEQLRHRELRWEVLELIGGSALLWVAP